MVKRIIKDLLFGIVCLIAINVVGQHFNFHIPFNVITILLVGIFRLPGLIVILLVLLI